MAHSQHYIFAHIALRHLAFLRSADLLNTLDSPRCEGLLGQLLRNIATKTGATQSFHASDIKVTSLLLRDRPCAILQMPPPEQTAEAYFVAIWSRYEPYALADKAIASSPANQPLVDYFTLERAAILKRKCNRSSPKPLQPTRLCNWDHKGWHRSHGAGPVPIYEQFVEFLTDFQLPKPSEDDVLPIEG